MKKENPEQIDEISRNLARRYIRKVADKTNTGELSTKEVEKRRPGVNLAGKKAYPGYAGEPRVRATEEFELDESSEPTDHKKERLYHVNKAAAAGLTMTQRKAHRHAADLHGMAAKDFKYADAARKASAALKEEAEQIDELSRKTLASYASKATDNAHGNIEKGYGEYEYGDPRKGDKHFTTAQKRKDGVQRAISKLAKEEAEQIDELSRKTLSSYVKRATPDAMSQGVKGMDFKNENRPKHFNKAMSRMKGIQKAADKLAYEETSVDMVEQLAKFIAAEAKNK